MKYGHYLVLLTLPGWLLASQAQATDGAAEQIEIETAPAAPGLSDGLPLQVLMIPDATEPALPNRPAIQTAQPPAMAKAPPDTPIEPGADTSITEYSPDGIAYPAAPSQLTGTTPHYRISALSLGMPMVTAISTLITQFPAIEQHRTLQREASLIQRDQTLHTSFRLRTGQENPAHLSEIQISWVSPVYPTTQIHQEVIRQLRQSAGQPLSWQQALSLIKQHQQEQIAQIEARLEENRSSSKRFPELGVVLNFQQRKLNQYQQKLQRLAARQRIEGRELCNALALDYSHCHFRGWLKKDSDDSLISENSTCRFWLQNSSEQLSACRISTGVQVRLSSRHIDYPDTTDIAPQIRL